MFGDRKFHNWRQIRADIAQALGALCLILALAPGTVVAADETTSPRNLPRYESLRDDLVYLRIGPGQEYKVRWELRRLGLPVMIFGEYGNWRRVRLHDGEEGWIHSVMLKKTRFATPQPSGAVIRSRPRLDGVRVAKVGPTFPLRLRACEVNWCEVEAGGFDGWVRKAEIWGVTNEERF
ncbi:MAG: SH3 domain-containing protein [Pseudomonadota bacterium]